MISNFHSQMAISKNIDSLLIPLLGVVLLTQPVYGRELEILQKNYRFNMPVTQSIVEQIFVITGVAKLGAEQSGVEKTVFAPGRIMVHFPFGKHTLSPAQKESLLNEMSDGKIGTDTPLDIKGYTCLLGPEQYNQKLSLQRAEAVAHFLRVQGFSVEKIQGKGSQKPVTDDPAQYYKNRRVKIHIHHRE